MVLTLMMALGELFSAEARLTPEQRLERALREAIPRIVAELEGVVRGEGIHQLHNPRTGVTCTMRIVGARPVDPQAVVPAPEEDVDPGIRAKGVSPCVD